jgi:hypothetical protein
VHCVPGDWLVARCDDVRPLFSDPRVASDPRPWERDVPAPEGSLRRELVERARCARARGRASHRLGRLHAARDARASIAFGPRRRMRARARHRNLHPRRAQRCPDRSDGAMRLDRAARRRVGSTAHQLDSREISRVSRRVPRRSSNRTASEVRPVRWTRFRAALDREDCGRRRVSGRAPVEPRTKDDEQADRCA